MKKLLELFLAFQMSIFILLIFMLSILVVSTNSWANGGPYEEDYNCPRCECPDVTVNCTCKTPQQAIPMKAEADKPKHPLVVSGGIRLGYHAYTANDFLNNFPESDQGAYNSPSGDQPFPPIEGEVNVSILKYFSVSALVGTYMGKYTDSRNDLSKTQTIYFMVMPRFDYTFSFKLKDTPVTMKPYLGLGLGGAYYTVWHDPSVYFFPPPSSIDEQHFVFAYSPSVGMSIPLIYVEPDMEDPPLGIDKSRLKLLMDYRYIGAQYKNFNAGGHLFLVGLGMDF